MSRALLLAAGKATRLGALRDRYAKACVPIAGTTPLRFAIEALAAAGVRELVINLHWQGEQVRAAAEQARPAGLRLRFLEEETLLGTGGTLLACQESFGFLPDLVSNAKLFTDLDWSAVLRAAPGSLVLHTASPLAEFGGLLYDERGQVRGLLSRQQLAEGQTPPPAPAGAAVYTGICRPDPAWLPFLQRDAAPARAEGKPLCLVRSGFLPALAAGVQVPSLLHHGAWCEISTPERVRAAEELVRSLPGTRHKAPPSDEAGFGVA